MKKWPTKPLGDAYWFQEGPGVRKWQFRDCGIKLLNVGNIAKEGVLDLTKTDRHLSREEASEKYSHFLMDEGDLVIASSGISLDEDGLLRTRGAFVQAQHLPLCLNTSTVRFKSKRSISTLAWLRYWLDSAEFRAQITRLVTGSAQLNFGPSHLEATKISLPPLAEQERIVGLLDEADALRKLRTQADKRTASLIPALFHQMFGDPATNPKGWLVKPLSEIAFFQEGPGIRKWQFHTSGVKLINVGNLVDGSIDLKKTDRHLDPVEVADTYRHFLLEAGDLVMATSGATWGKVAFVEAHHLPLCLNTSVVRFRPLTKATCEATFLRGFFETGAFRIQIERLITGSAQPNFGPSHLQQVRLPLPPLSLQKEFAARVAEIRSLEAEQAAGRQRHEALFQSMLHRAFNGEL